MAFSKHLHISSRALASGRRQVLSPARLQENSPILLNSQPSPHSISSSSAASSTNQTRSCCSHPPVSKSNPNCVKNNTRQHIATMSTMPASHGHSQACCNIPPVQAKGYSAKGSYEELGGYKSYVTGPSDATKGVLIIFDIFGYYPQTLQGADILSSSDAKQKYQVFMPDWFKGEPCPIEIFPPDTDDKQKQLGAFFEKNPPPGVANQVPEYIKAVQSKHSQIKEWAIVGFCWGGKVVSLVTSSPDNTFKAGVECHPAMVEPEDAKKIKVPLCLLASKDEPVEDVKKFEQNLSGPKHVESFSDQIHGWMAARSDLEDSRVKDEYTRGYQTVVEFLGKHL